MDIRQLTKSIQKSVKQGCKQHRAKQKKAMNVVIPVDTTIRNEWYDFCLNVAKEVHPRLRVSIFASYWIALEDREERR